MPKLEELIAQREEELKAQREEDNNKLDELVDSLKEWNVDVIEVNCDR